jgi:hypothetical protein
VEVSALWVSRFLTITPILTVSAKSSLQLIFAIQFLTAVAFVKKTLKVCRANLQGPIFLLVAQVKAFGDSQVTLVVGLAQISQHAAALPNKLEQSAPARLIFFVDPEMVGQLLDTAGQDGDLHFRGAGVRIMAMIVCDQFGLNFFRERHDVCFLSLDYGGNGCRTLQVSMLTARCFWGRP